MQKSIKIINHIDNSISFIDGKEFLENLNIIEKTFIFPCLNNEIKMDYVWERVKQDILVTERYKKLSPIDRCSYNHYKKLSGELKSENQIIETGFISERFDSNHFIPAEDISDPGICRDNSKGGTSIRDNTYDYLQNKFTRVFEKEFNFKQNLTISGRPLWYKHFDGIDGYMGWHTNHNNPEKRWYLVYNTDENSSFFRYIDPKTDEMITHWEPKGWSVNYFEPGDTDNKLWHCVYTKTNRFSFGFRLNRQRLTPIYELKNGWDNRDIPADIPGKDLRYKDDVKPRLCKSGNIVDTEYDKTMLGELIYDLLYIDDTIRSSWDREWISQRDKLESGYQNYNPVTRDSWRDSLLASWTYPRGNSDKTFAMLHPHSVPYFTDDDNRKALQKTNILHKNLLDNNYDVEKDMAEYSKTSIKPSLPEKYKFINNIIDQNYCNEKGPFECLRQLNLFSWDLPSINWLKSKIYKNLKEWFPYIDEESYILGWCNIIKNNHHLIWHTHYDKLGLQNHKDENVPLSTNVILCPPKESKTWTEFYDPDIGRWKIPSEPGTMMSFDSRILHVPGNTDNMKDDEFRISLAMDIINPNIDLGKKKWHLTRDELYSTRLSTVEGLLGKHNDGLLGFLSDYDFKNNRDRDKLWEFLDQNSGYIKLKNFKESKKTPK